MEKKEYAAMSPEEKRVELWELTTRLESMKDQLKDHTSKATANMSHAEFEDIKRAMGEEIKELRRAIWRLVTGRER